MQESMDLVERLASERDHLEKGKDKAETKLQVVEQKYHDLLIELNNLKLSDKCHVSQLESELKLKKFETDRLSVLYSESKKKMESALLEKDRLTEKLDVLREEFSLSQIEANKKIATLTMHLENKTCQLQTYEKLEAELDNVVMQAAALPSNEDAHEIVAAYGSGANMPLNVKQRLYHSLSLARRVLELELRATENKNELFAARDRCQSLSRELDAAKSAFELSGQPTTELLEVIKNRGIEIGTLKDNLKGLGLSFDRVLKSNFQLQAKLTQENSSNSVFTRTNMEHKFPTRSCTLPNAKGWDNVETILPKAVIKHSAGLVTVKKPLTFSKTLPEK